MAKIFYTLEEAASKLRKSPEEVREMASKGQLQEFRDRDKLMFKVEQVDLLAPDDDDDTLSLGGSEAGGSGIDLADSSTDDWGSLSLEDSAPGEPAQEQSAFGLADLDDEPAPASGSGLGGASGSGLSPADSAGRSGISVFDVDELEQADPSAVTQVNDGGGFADMLEDSQAGSGSGLMDLTRENDDTSLGIDNLDEIYADENASAETIGASGLFESSGAESDEAFGAAAEPAALGGGGVGGAVALAEPYDGPGSGLVGGLSLGAALALALAMTVVIIGMLGVGSGPILSTLADNFMIVLGGLAGAVVLFALIGWFLGKRS